MNYLVMECHPGYAVVLSEDGRFLKVANMRYQVGQTVRRITEVTLPQEQPVTGGNRQWIPRLAAMAACLVIAVTSMFLYWQLPYASVYMSINPQVRIQVNRSDRVLDVEGLNADGEQLLAHYTPGRKDLDTVMDELADRALRMGYLHEGGQIILRLDGSEQWINSHSSHLKEHLTAHLKETVTVTVDVQTKEPPAPEPAAPTAPAGPIVIPVVPDAYGDSDYGESDYGAEPDYGDSGYDESDYSNSGYADSGYEVSDYGDSGYDSSGDSGYSDYAEASGGQTDSGESDYIAPAPVPAAPADSGYDDPDSDYSDSGYSDYGQSDYDD